MDYINKLQEHFKDCDVKISDESFLDDSGLK